MISDSYKTFFFYVIKRVKMLDIRSEAVNLRLDNIFCTFSEVFDNKFY